MHRPAWTRISSAASRPTSKTSETPPRAGKNPNLGPLDTAPYYAVKLYPGDIGAATGFATDASARVLNASGQPIDGLYAVGNDMHSIMGGVYTAPGITIGRASSSDTSPRATRRNARVPKGYPETLGYS